MDYNSNLLRATIIIPVCNGWRDTVECLGSLRPTLRPGDEVVVVDNGSADETVVNLNSYDWVTLIRNNEDLGYSVACNQGADIAKNDLLIFLHNDTTFFEGWLDELISPFSDQRIGAAGPRSNNAPGQQGIEGISYEAGDFTARAEFAMAWHRTHTKQVYEAARLGGFCLAVKLDAFKCVGGFDEGYRNPDIDDDDLSLKLRSAGYNLVVANGCFVHHSGHTAIEAENAEWYSVQSEDMGRFKEKWGVGGVPPLILVSVCLIVKDEEKMLGSCLSSVEEIADEIIVYDTGSTDRTVEIARAHGATVIEGYWDDSFARARNAALEAAHGKWVLSIDADEVFLCDPIQLRTALLDWNSKIEGFLVSIENLHGPGNAPSVHTAIRLFRREACIWRHRLHEQVVAADDLSRRLEVGYLSGSRLIHYGYSAEVFDSKNKAERNLALAKAAVDDGEVSKPYALMNLGRALEGVGKSDEAVNVLTGAAEISTDPIVQRLAVRNLISILGRQGRFEQALSEVDHLRRISVSQIAADIAEGHLRIAMGEPEIGLGLLARVPQRGRDDEGMEYQAHMLAAMRGSAYASLGRYGEAADVVLEAVRTSGILEADIGELTWWLLKAGRQPGEIADSIGPSDLVPVLGRVVRQPVPIADILAETMWLRFPDRLEPLAVGARIAAKLPIARAMIWSSRLRQKGLQSSCPLLAIAQDENMHPSLRVLAAAAAYGTFGDRSVINPFHDAKSLLSGKELEDSMGQIARIAPGLIYTKRSEVSEAQPLLKDDVPLPAKAILQQPRVTIRKVSPIANRGGVNIVGSFRSSMSYGEIARSIANALIEIGVKVSATDFDTGYPPTKEDWEIRDDGDYPYDTTLVVLPPEELSNFVIESGISAFEGRYMIGYWTWDYPVPSKIMETASQMVHEIWTPSLFSARSIRSVSDRVVSRMGLPLSVYSAPSADSSEFEFLYSIDYALGVDRQNPMGMIEAFKLAFPEPGSQRLVIEAGHCDLYPSDHAMISEVVHGREDIVIIENRHMGIGDFLSGRDPSSCCFVSPHRSDGTGIAIAKSMMLGIPTIVTGNSFSSEFQSKQDCFRVGFLNDEFDPGGAIFIKSGYWAAPKASDLIEAMRLVRKFPDRARDRGKRGIAKSRPYFNRTEVAKTMKSRLELIDCSRYRA